MYEKSQSKGSALLGDFQSITEDSVTTLVTRLSKEVSNAAGPPKLHPKR